MTPFMIAVQSLLEGEQQAPAPHTEPSQARSVAVATDAQVMVRSLAEQLVCEANSVLAEHGAALTLVDDSGPNELAFTMGYRDRSARVRTTLSGRTAVAQLLIPGLPGDQARQLSTEDELQALVLSLVAG